MANLNGVNTNAEPAKPSFGYEPAPKGWYKVVIESEEVKNSQKTGVPYLVFKVKVIEGEHKNRVVWPMLHLWNETTFTDSKTGEVKSVKALAEMELASIKEACGKQVINDSRQLHMIPVEAFFIIEDKPGYEPKNVIKGWRAIKSSVPTAGGTSKPSTPPTSLPTSSPAGRSDAGYVDDVPGDPPF